MRIRIYEYIVSAFLNIPWAVRPVPGHERKSGGMAHMGIPLDLRFFSTKCGLKVGTHTMSSVRVPSDTLEPQNPTFYKNVGKRKLFWRPIIGSVNKREYRTLSTTKSSKSSR